MKYLYNKSSRRRGDGERHYFAFFVIGAIVVLAAVFVIGLQVGRFVEKGKSAGGSQAKGTSTPQAVPGSTRPSASEIGKNLGAFSEEAGKVPAVPPPDAMAAGSGVEKSLTFQDSLSRKDAGPIPLVAPARKDNAAVQAKADGGKKQYIVQAGSFREKEIAETFRKRLSKAGYSVRVVIGTGGKNREKYYRVLVGPYSEREGARKASEKLKKEMRVESRILTVGG